MMAHEDQYSRFEYRRLIGWSSRIEREWPFLERHLSSAPETRVIDFGSGTGEHARFLASQGFDVTGIDASESMVAKSREIDETDGTKGKVEFVLGDLREASSIVPGSFGGAICLGNVLPHLTGKDDLNHFAQSAAALLRPGSPVVIQILNYDRIEAKGERNLPLNFRPDPDTGGTIVFVRIIEMLDDGMILFFPSTLLLHPERDEPLELVASKRVELRGWRAADLDRAFEKAGFDRIEHFGGFDGSEFDPNESRDLVFVARRTER